MVHNTAAADGLMAVFSRTGAQFRLHCLTLSDAQHCFCEFEYRYEKGSILKTLDLYLHTDRIRIVGWYRPEPVHFRSFP